MISDSGFDEDLVRRLPLPLAQLYRRADNAKSAFECHATAFYLWEVAIKLLGSVAIVQYTEQSDPDSNVFEWLQQALGRASLGDWWEFSRRLVPLLAERGDEGFQRVREILLGQRRDDLPFAAGLIAALTEVLDGKIRLRGDTRPRIHLAELFDQLVRYRNSEVGHGTVRQRATEFLRADGTSVAPGGIRSAGAAGRAGWPKVAAHR
jgi:hypothetical protein